jgi:hypothetical protein
MCNFWREIQLTRINGDTFTGAPNSIAIVQVFGLFAEAYIAQKIKVFKNLLRKTETFELNRSLIRAGFDFRKKKNLRKFKFKNLFDSCLILQKSLRFLLVHIVK